MPLVLHWTRWSGRQGAAGALRSVSKRQRGKSAWISTKCACGRPGTGTSHWRCSPMLFSRSSVLKRGWKPMKKGGLAGAQPASISGIRHGRSSALTANGAGSAAVIMAVRMETGPLVAACARLVVLASQASGQGEVLPLSTASHSVSSLTAAVVLGPDIRQLTGKGNVSQTLKASMKKCWSQL
jgi:hypothetical protein